MINHRVPPFGPAPFIDVHEILGSTVAGDSRSVAEAPCRTRARGP